MEDCNSVKKRFVNGVLWGIFEKIATLFVGFFITILLARKLIPEDYGLINMIYIFTVLAMVLVDGGFGQALIQKKDANIKDYSSVFYFNFFISIIIYILLFFSAPYIADFYHQERLVLISRVSFLLIPINSFSVIQHTLLTKRIEVKKLSIVSIYSSLLSGILGVILAYLDFGVWALVFQNLSLYLIRTIILWLVNDWRPALVFEIESIKSIWRFSMNLLGVHTLAAVFQNIYTVLIGRYFNVIDVGYYNQAQRLQMMASGTINDVVQRVSFPAFSEIQEDRVRLKSVYRKVINMVMYINLPIMIGLIIPAKSIFYVLLSEKWLPSVLYFRILCIIGVLFPLHMINVIVLKALKKGNIYFNLEMLKRCLMVVFIFFTINQSILFLLLGMVISTIISVFINMYYCGKVINFSIKEQLIDFLPIICSSLILVFCQYIVLCLGFNHYLNLVLQIMVVLLVIITTSVLFKIESYFELKKIIINKFIKR